MLTGLVGSAGTRVLRREAVPLYVILAESQVRNDAESVVVMRGGSAVHTLRLSDPVSLNTTVINGDVITVGRSQDFYYIAGSINYPGQKNFQTGITLLQAILAAGGTARHADAVDLSPLITAFSLTILPLFVSYSREPSHSCFLKTKT
jgi:hypothetical protein